MKTRLTGRLSRYRTRLSGKSENPALQKAEIEWKTALWIPGQNPRSGTKATARTAAPAPSTRTVIRMMLRTRSPRELIGSGSRVSLRIHRPRALTPLPR